MTSALTIRAIIIGGLASLLFAPLFSASAQQQATFSSEYTRVFETAQAALDSGNFEAARAQLPGLLALSISPDERLSTGGLMYNAGNNRGDPALQLQGMEMMLGSGKLTPADVARYNFVAYQLANALQDYPRSRGFLQKAIDGGFTTETIGKADLQITMAESYFSGGEFIAGLDYLDKAIKARKASGQLVDAQWYRRGITVAYNNQITPQVYDFVVAWLADFPTIDNWRDGINIVRNLNNFDADELFELGLLANRVGVPLEKKFRSRPPKKATGIEKIADQKFLSGEYGPAEVNYIIAIQTSRTQNNELYMRLGISQIEQGKAEQSLVSFEKVSGQRESIARLWAVYVMQEYDISIKYSDDIRNATSNQTPADKCFELGFIRGTEEFYQCVSMVTE